MAKVVVRQLKKAAQRRRPADTQKGDYQLSIVAVFGYIKIIGLLVYQQRVAWRQSDSESRQRFVYRLLAN